MSGHIVIAGCGFAGLSAARTIGRKYDVTMLDRTADFDFLPNIHEIVSGLKTPQMVQLSRSKLAKQLGHTFVQDAVAELDPAARAVVTESGTRIVYDALILAPGGQPRGLDVPGVKEHAQTFASAEDARSIRRRIDVLRGMSGAGYITIVGGGVSGVELLGEILRRYRKDENLNVRLIESKDRLLRGWPGSIAKRVKKLAEDRGVTIFTEKRVTAVEKAAITLDDGRVLPSDLTLWVTGTSAPEFIRKSPLAIGANGWAEVNEGLQVDDYPEVFIAGDACDAPKPPKKQAAEALRLGEQAAKNAKRYLSGKSPKEFRRKKSPYLITFGDLGSFLILADGETVMDSKALGAGREVVFQATMAELDDASKNNRGGRISKRMRTSLLRLPWSDPVLLPFELVDGLLDFRVR